MDKSSISAYVAEPLPGANVVERAVARVEAWKASRC